MITLTNPLGKVYKIGRRGATVKVFSGRRGSILREVVKTFPSATEAKSYMNMKRAGRIANGYEQLTLKEGGKAYRKLFAKSYELVLNREGLSNDQINRRWNNPLLKVWAKDYLRESLKRARRKK